MVFTVASNFSGYNSLTGGKVKLFTTPPLTNVNNLNQVINIFNNTNSVSNSRVIMTSNLLFYPSLNLTNPSDDLINRIKESTINNPNVQPPLFLVCYGLLNDNYYYNATKNGPNYIFELIQSVQNKLMNDKYNVEVVSIEDLAFLASQV